MSTKKDNGTPWFKGEPSDKKDASSRMRAAQQAQAMAIFNQRRAAATYWGQTPGALGELNDLPLECLPASLPATRTHKVPLTEEAFKELFGPDIFFTDFETIGSGFVSKMTRGASPLAPFFVKGVCLILRYEPLAFTQKGAAFDNTLTKIPRIPEVIPVTGTLDDPKMAPAVLEYGHSTWLAAWHLMSAYNLQYILQGNFMMIDERAVDVGMVDTQAKIEGFGTGQIDPLRFNRQANAHYRELGSDQSFAPANVTTADQQGVALGPQLVDVQYGGPHNPGIFACQVGCIPVRPHVLFPAQNYQFLLSRTPAETTYYPMLEDDLTTGGLQTPDAKIPAEQNTDPPAPPIWCGHIRFPYGVFQVGVILRGSEVIPADALSWFLTFGKPYESLLASNRAAYENVAQMARLCGLKGVPRPLEVNDKRREQGGALGALTSTSRDEQIRALVALSGCGELASSEEYLLKV